jgi:hypothetical protein
MTDPNGAAILMVTFIYHQYTPFMLALIYHGSVMGIPFFRWEFHVFHQLMGNHGHMYDVMMETEA